jgi:hypothetical protein
LRRAPAIAALGLAVAAACGGGGGGGGGGGPTPPVARFAFTPASSGAAGTLALASGSGSTLATLRLDLLANQVAGLYAVGFDLTYPNATMRFAAATEGTFLNAGSTATTSFQVLETQPGRLVVGLSRLGPAAGVSGSGTVMSFEFTAVAAGSGALAFADAQGYDAAGRPLSNVGFAGGSVVYQP